jgi:anaerobic ribonucleoside-triphosphate reductase activating protein
MMERSETTFFPGNDQAGCTDILNVAAVCPSTRSLGPGIRAVVWVQGCFFRCPGCIAPGWIPIQPARMVTQAELLNELLADPAVNGLTFSGGEPMLQAPGLARLARAARQVRELNIICFSGFTLSHLKRVPPGPGVDDLLEQVDVLIDGPYIEQLNDNRGLRGSSNQQVHFLTDRLKGYDLAGEPRRAEIRLQNGEAMLVGVPPDRLGEAFRQAVDQAAGMKGRLRNYERV